MVHADVVGTMGDVKGRTYGHAFILLGDNQVLDVCTNSTIAKDEYYRVGQVSNVKEYTPEEALKTAVEKGTYGPWH